MARYRNTQISTKNNKNSYRTTIYESVPDRNTDDYFIAQEGDRCDNLATQFYGNPNLWWFIARANNLKTNNIPAGTKLRIPAGIVSAKGS
jgi:nucleoid-associated protein YgaU